MSRMVSRRTIGANFRSRSSASIIATRSSAVSSSRSVLALRVTRNSSTDWISMPGNMSSRQWAMTSSRRTNSSRPATRRNLGTPAPVGTLIRAMVMSASWGKRSVTSRFKDRLEMNGNGCAGSIASGVTSGKTFSW